MLRDIQRTTAQGSPSRRYVIPALDATNLDATSRISSRMVLQRRRVRLMFRKANCGRCARLATPATVLRSSSESPARGCNNLVVDAAALPPFTRMHIPSNSPLCRPLAAMLAQPQVVRSQTTAATGAISLDCEPVPIFNVQIGAR